MFKTNSANSELATETSFFDIIKVGLGEGLIGFLFFTLFEIDQIIRGEFPWAYLGLILMPIIGTIIFCFLHQQTKPGLTNSAQRSAIGGAVLVIPTYAYFVFTQSNNEPISTIYVIPAIGLLICLFGFIGGGIGIVGGICMAYLQRNDLENFMQLKREVKALLRAVISMFLIFTGLDLLDGITSGNLWQTLWEGIPGTMATGVLILVPATIFGYFRYRAKKAQEKEAEETNPIVLNQQK